MIAIGTKVDDRTSHLVNPDRLVCFELSIVSFPKFRSGLPIMHLYCTMYDLRLISTWNFLRFKQLNSINPETLEGERFLWVGFNGSEL